jgi:hypothetical protein
MTKAEHRKIPALGSKLTGPMLRTKGVRKASSGER